jgi:hypothetical protein
MRHTLGEIRHKYNILIGGGQGKDHLGKHRGRCDDNIEMEFN